MCSGFLFPYKPEGKKQKKEEPQRFSWRELKRTTKYATNYAVNIFLTVIVLFSGLNDRNMASK